MVKRRRKLSKDYEKNIERALKDVELITAKINDINEDDIREEYQQAFSIVKLRLDNMNKAYKDIGFNEESTLLLSIYQESLKGFINEYEI